MKLQFILSLAFVMVAVVISSCSQSPNSEVVSDKGALEDANSNASGIVSALGRIEPKGKVIHVSGPSELASGRVIEVFVEEGDTVESNQAIAIFDNYYTEQAKLNAARQRVKVVQAQLKKVQQGEAKNAEILAQEAEVARLESELRNQVTEKSATIERVKAELRNAERAYQRFQSLSDEGGVSALDVDERREQFETAQARLKEVTAQFENVQSSLEEQLRRERATLDTLKEVRPVDIAVAQAELAEAVAQVIQAKANFELSQVQAPVRGQILKIHTFPGERVDSAGIVDLGQVEEMYVVAEIYETDIPQVAVGQSALVSGGALNGTLRGTVEQISVQLGKRDLFSTDPTLEIDARVFEVKIRLKPSDSAQASKLINSQVEVRINSSS